MDALIPRSLLLGNPDRAQPRVSPDGAWLSWLAPVDDVLNVWVAPWGDPGAARPVTSDRGRGIRNHQWSEGSTFLLFEQDVDGDEDFVLFAVTPAGDPPRQLTPSGARAQLTGTSPERPDHVVVLVNDRVPELMDPVLVDLRTGERTRLAENDGAVGYAMDRRDLSVRVAVYMTAEGGAVWRVLGEGGRDEVVGPEDVLTTSFAGFDVDGAEWWLDSRGRETSGLVRIRGGVREVVAAHDRGDIADLLQDAGGRVRAAWAVYADREPLIVDPAIGVHLAALGAHRSGTPVVAACSSDDRRWVVGWHSSAGPVAYAAYDTGAGGEPVRIRELFLDRTALADQPLAERHPSVLRSRDGWDLVSYLTLPRWVEVDAAGRPAEPLPMVLLVHGGPWARDLPGYEASHQLLANRGCAVLSVNYRGSSGLGKRFLNAGDREWAGRMHDDLLDAVGAMVDRGVADPARLAIMGGSYGGYATLVGLTFTPEVFACGVDIVGPSSLLTFLAAIPPYWKPMKVQFHTRVGDDETEEGRAELWRRSPLSRVDAIRRPLLIAQGANDPRVKQAESDQLVAELERRGIPVTYALFPDEGHGFARPENRVAFMALAEEFFARHLGVRCEARGEAIARSSVLLRGGTE